MAHMTGACVGVRDHVSNRKSRRKTVESNSDSYNNPPSQRLTWRLVFTLEDTTFSDLKEVIEFHEALSFNSNISHHSYTEDQAPNTWTLKDKPHQNIVKIPIKK